MAAHLAPSATRSRHPLLPRFAADSAWSDEQIVLRVAQRAVPAVDFSDGGWWIVDDTGLPKPGQHSVGVARQCGGMPGKRDNRQPAVSARLACRAGSLPVAWWLYVPTRQRLGDARHQGPLSVKELTFELDPSQRQALEWREGSSLTLRS